MTVAASDLRLRQPVPEPLSVTRARYASAAGTPFRRVGSDAGAVSLELVVVSPLRASSSQESFSLELTGPAELRLDQGTHVLEHPQLGRVELFIVPIAREGDRIRYEAIFNRLVAPIRGAGDPSGGSGAA